MKMLNSGKCRFLRTAVFFFAMVQCNGFKLTPKVQAWRFVACSANLEGTGVIKLDSFLKFTGAADTGGSAKALLAAGHVMVNGVSEVRRGRKLRDGDSVQVEELQGAVTFDVIFDGRGRVVVPVAKDTGATHAPTIAGKMNVPPNFHEDNLLVDGASDTHSDEDDLLADSGRDAFDFYDDESDDESDSMWEDPSGSSTGSSESTEGIIHTKSGLSVRIDHASTRDVDALAAKGWAPPELISGERKGWVAATLVRGFGGVIGVCRLSEGKSLDDADVRTNVLEISSLAVEPQSRQRGVAGALVDFAVGSSALPVVAKVPSFKNKAARTVVEELLGSRGVECQRLR
eukprot:CAMPEP_0185769026 /NCGR_PEP_ID=MMETSP1174-20130828/53320_1 /TAXON_ID=35687 /ORGANISM="Dictyocha speculum, Strain CCMP1381" /LENGTH=343 /DNA_ID=CAMNT_0028453957 /DNA_START=15 /DNA_END=1046 /DNA_ORIENTATION=+